MQLAVDSNKLVAADPILRTVVMRSETQLNQVTLNRRSTVIIDRTLSIGREIAMAMVIADTEYQQRFNWSQFRQNIFRSEKDCWYAQLRLSSAARVRGSR